MVKQSPVLERNLLHSEPLAAKCFQWIKNQVRKYNQNTESEWAKTHASLGLPGTASPAILRQRVRLLMHQWSALWSAAKSKGQLSPEVNGKISSLALNHTTFGRCCYPIHSRQNTTNSDWMGWHPSPAKCDLTWRCQMALSTSEQWPLPVVCPKPCPLLSNSPSITYCPEVCITRLRLPILGSSTWISHDGSSPHDRGEHRDPFDC